MVGRKRALIIGLVGFAVASAIGGASVNFVMLHRARTVQDDAALLAPSVLALLTTTFAEPDERGKAFGIHGAIAGAGGALGLLLGGILTSYESWRWTLFVNLVFAVGATAGSFAWLSRDNSADHNPPGSAWPVLSSRRAVHARLRVLHAETTGWGNPYTIGFLIVAGVVLLAGIHVRARAKVRVSIASRRSCSNRTSAADLYWWGCLAASGFSACSCS